MLGVWPKKKLWRFVSEQAKSLPISIGLSDGNELGVLRIFCHLVPKKQQLLKKTKEFKDQNHYHICWARNSTVYLKKDEGSRTLKIADMDCLRRIVLYT